MIQEKTIFEQRTAIFTQEAQTYSRKALQISWIRVFWFVGSVALVGWLWINFTPTLSIFVGFIVLLVFIFLIRWYNYLLFQKNHQQHLIAINEREIAFSQYDFESKKIAVEQGEEFAEPSHFYSHDLDIFGKKSIFWLLNRSHTALGKKTLADWLKTPSNPAVLLQRQEAVEELNQEIDFSQDFEARAMHQSHTQEVLTALLAWEKSAPLLVHQKSLVLSMYALSLFSLGSIAAGVWLSSYVWFLFPLLLNGFLWRKHAQKINLIYEQTFQAYQALKSYQLLLEAIERSNVKAECLVKLKENLLSSHKKLRPSQAIQQLSKIIYLFSQRQNALFSGIANGFFLWDFWQILALERWKKRNEETFTTWFETVAEFEALNSLAGFYRVFETDLNFPTFASQDFFLEAKNLGHPLIAQKDRVCNDILLEGLGKTLLITGSNMSGKTTFERTLGVSIVLALAGSPVLAQSFTLSEMQVFTSMRTQDSLQENLSSFYAELKRLKHLIDTLNKADAPVVFYLLDEILKGTNSADRHKGAEALIRQLHLTTASGLVSTHDLELGKLAEETDFVQNHHFKSEVQAGNITFDYKLYSGICHSFNATALMQMMGIAIKSEITHE